MAKSGRELVKLESTAGTGYFYVTTKNRRTTTGKLEFMKYDPKARRHVKFVEKKLK
jgi:large subunit ribosomal protein L33